MHHNTATRLIASWGRVEARPEAIGGDINPQWHAARWRPGKSESRRASGRRALDRRLAAACARRLPRVVFDFIEGGAGDEVTLRDNEAAFQDWQLVPRVAVDVSRRSTVTDVVGRRSELPFLLAPTGFAGFFWPSGEVAAASAAAAAGIPFCLSTNSVASLEVVAEVQFPTRTAGSSSTSSKDRDWMHCPGRAGQDRELSRPLPHRRSRRSRAPGARHPQRLHRAARPTAATVLDLARRPRWLAGALLSPPRFGNFEGAAPGGFTSVAQHVSSLFDPSVTWDDVARIRDLWQGPVVIKGVLHPDDAERAVALGASAVIVSNHGGRQLDQVPAPISVLPEIVSAVGGRAQVILDGGIRRGTDILKALALGASSCSLGRAFLWGCAPGGQKGSDKTITILRDELDNAMTLLGTVRIEDVSAGHVRPRYKGAA